MEVRTTMAAVAGGDGTTVQFYSPSGETIRHELGGRISHVSNTGFQLAYARDAALAEQFVRMFNVLSASCGGPGR